MSVQEPQDQFERDRTEDEIEESDDSLMESPLSNSDSFASTESESVDVPTEASDTL